MTFSIDWLSAHLIYTILKPNQKGWDEYFAIAVSDGRAAKFKRRTKIILREQNLTGKPTWK
jgi:hypothetical protein